MHKNHFPLLLPLLSLIAGILFAFQFQEPLNISYQSWFAAILISIAACLRIRKTTRIFIPYVIFFAIGCYAYLFNFELNSDNHFSKRTEASSLVINIYEVSATEKSKKIVAVVKSVIINGCIEKAKGKLLLYVPQQSNIQLRGDYLIPAKYQNVEIYRNPGVFNYALFLRKQNIFHRTYMKEDDLVLSAPASQYQMLVSTCQNKLSQLFISKFKNQEHAEIINSILLGQRQDLSKETRKLFNENGLAHLLAVSGMHVGIILLIIQFLVGGITNQVLKTTLIISGIWIYIIITGNQIPAIRAGFMMTLYLLGFLLNRQPKPLNSIFLAAMILLCIDANLLFQLSFQLSFSAMVSIFLFYPVISSLFDFKKNFLRTLWQMISLNIAVQILVLPITVYYFQQLPTYGVFNSIISTPFIIVIMWLGISAIAFSWIESACECILYVLEFILSVYIQVIDFVSALPYALVEGIEITSGKLIICISAIVLGYYLIIKKKVHIKSIILYFVPIIMMSSIIDIKTLKTSEIIVYDTPEQLVIDLVEPNHSIRLMEVPDEKNVSYLLPKIEKESTIKLHQNFTSINSNQIIDFKGKKIGICRDTTSMTTEAKLDLCIIRDSSIKMQMLTNCSKIIMPRFIESKNYEIDKLNQEKTLFLIRHKGAYILKF